MDDANSVLRGMLDVYATCTSYRDNGTSVNRYTERQSETVFKTAFRRPTDFRFEYTRDEDESGERMIVHRDKTGARSWFSFDREVKNTSLEMAIAGATGVSRCTAFTVPHMLLPDEIGGRGFLSCENWTTMEDTGEAGRGCYRLERHYGEGDSEILWIEKACLLLVRHDKARTVRRSMIESFKTERTTIYVPEINVEISEAELRFDAPEGLAKASTKPR